MKVGSKSVLFGVHCFLIHPWFVAMAWWRLYGFPWDPRLWVAFFVHDLGYWGKPNMDGLEGEMHPELGGRIMGWLFDRDPLIPRRTSAKLRKENQYEPVEWGAPSYFEWQNFTLGHSRYYSARLDIKPSKLCAADKLAFCFEPYWFYMLRANASGEIDEYLHITGFQARTSKAKRNWFKFYRRRMLRWVAGNYKNLGPRELKNGDRIRMTYIPPCRNGHGKPNPYIGMEGEVCDLDNGKFTLHTKGGAWLCCLDLKTDKFEYL
jgi:hypothetical protein